jgi:hypothetical protein
MKTKIFFYLLGFCLTGETLAYHNAEGAKGPLDFTPYTYAWVALLSVSGGIVSYLQKIKKGKARFSLAEILGECFISGFVGIITFWLCEYSHVNELLAAAFIGISGHMGSKIIYVLEEKLLSRYLLKWSGEQ